MQRSYIMDQIKRKCHRNVIKSKLFSVCKIKEQRGNMQKDARIYNSTQADTQKMVQEIILYIIVLRIHYLFRVIDLDKTAMTFCTVDLMVETAFTTTRDTPYISRCVAYVNSTNHILETIPHSLDGNLNKTKQNYFS